METPRLLRRLFDSPWLFFGLAALLLGGAVLSQFKFSPQPHPEGSFENVMDLAERDDLNVVFIVIDMLRADRTSVYGYHRETTPIIKQLAEGGIRFANVEAQSSWTKASMASMWTGMYPERTGVQRFFHAMPEEAHMPAEIFREAGYRTAGIWRNGWVANNFGFGQGFDLYIRPVQVRPEHTVRQHNPGIQRLPGTDMDATLSAIEFMTGAADEKFFLYIHYMDVHQYLYTDLSPDFGSGFADFYDSAIYWTDYNVGRLIEALQHLRIVDRTLVVIISDHGEAFFEHGIEGHARNLYKEVLKTPWIILPPVKLDQGVVVNQRVANVDVWPTLLDLIGLPPLEGAEGVSAVPLIEAAAERAATGAPPEAAETDRPIVAQLDRSWGRVGEEGRPTATLVKGFHRYYYRARLPGRPELFDQRTDPEELVNVASEQPEILAELQADLESFYSIEKTAWEAAPEVELDEMRQHQLRALGYVIQPARPKKDGEGDGADGDGTAATPGSAPDPAAAAEPQ
jgi:arylsulfatase A-like enzyme